MGLQRRLVADMRRIFGVGVLRGHTIGQGKQRALEFFQLAPRESRLRCFEHVWFSFPCDGAQHVRGMSKISVESFCNTRRN